MSEAHTATPWEWETADGSMISLGTVGDASGLGHVLTCHVCSACDQSGNRCMLPREHDMEYIVRACNSFEELAAAAQKVLTHLNERIQSASDDGGHSVPVFDGIAELVAALLKVK